MAVATGSAERLHMEALDRVPKATPAASTQDHPSLRCRERTSLLKNRIREICTSGSVRGGDGNISAYSAGCLGDRAGRTTGGIELPKARVGIGLQDAGVACQKGLRVLTPAIRRVEVGCRWWRRPAKGPVIPHHCPQPSGPGFALGQHRHGRVIGMDARAGKHMRLDRLDQWLERDRDGPTQSASVDTSIGTPSRAKRSLWRCRGKCSPYLAKTTSAKRFGPARPRAIGWNGAGASVIASHARQDTFSRTCWTTNQLAGTRSRLSVTTSPSLRTRPPQHGQAAGAG